MRNESQIFRAVGLLAMICVMHAATSTAEITNIVPHVLYSLQGASTSVSSDSHNIEVSLAGGPNANAFVWVEFDLYGPGYVTTKCSIESASGESGYALVQGDSDHGIVRMQYDATSPWHWERTTPENWSKTQWLWPYGGHFVLNATFSGTGAKSAKVTLAFRERDPNLGPVIDPPGPAGGDGGLTNAVTNATCSSFVVITHGWNSSPAQVNGLLDSELTNDSCVVFFDWQAAANTGSQDPVTMVAMLAAAAIGKFNVDLFHAYLNAQQQGHALFQALQQMIASGQILPGDIKLVGHSFGGVVNGVAATELSNWLRGYQNGALGTKIGEMVVLDTPQLGIWLPATSHIDPNTANRVINVYAGLSSLAFGGPIPGNNVVNVGLDLDARSPGDIGHLRVPQIWPSVSGDIRPLPPGNYHEVFYPGPVPGTGYSVFSSGNPSYAYGPYVHFPGLLVHLPPKIFFDLRSCQGHNAQLVEEEEALVLMLKEESQQGTNAAQVYRTLTIPSTAHFMELQYRVKEPGDGDELLISCGTNLLYHTSLFRTNETFISSGPVFVGDLAGTAAVFCVTLLGTGSDLGTSVLIKDPVFYYAGVPHGQDTDHDGIWDGFEMIHTGSLTNMNETTDTDCDGVSDVAESLADTNPLDPNDFLRITAVNVSTNATATDVTLTWRSTPTRRYIIESVPYLGMSWPTNSLGLYVTPDEGTSTVRTVSGGLATQMFYRVKAIIPETP